MAQSIVASRRHGADPPAVRWVDLAPILEPAEVPRVVAAALQLRDASGTNPSQAVVDALRDRRLLLVLDNAEHLAAAVRRLVRLLLVSCPGVVVLVTSRSALHVPGESAVAVQPLETARPSAGARSPTRGGHHAAAHSEASRLFLDRTVTVAPGFVADAATLQVIERLCERLGGLPLAIELAASWMRVVTAGDLLADIDRSLDVLSSASPGSVSRHRSMRAVLESSWQWLGEDERKVFSALAVFRGNVSREAAEAVCGATLSSLAVLSEMGLIQRLPDSEGETRYRIHALVRQFVLDRLEAHATRAHSARQRHLDYYLALVGRAEQTWDTELETTWLTRLGKEQPDLDAALRWAMDGQQTEVALRLTAGLFSFWLYTSPLERYRSVLDEAMSLPWDATSREVSRTRARAANVAGYAAVVRADFATAVSWFDEGLALSLELGEERATAWAWRGRSFARRLAGDALGARQDEERSLELCLAVGDVRGEAWSLHDLGEIAYALGDLDRAERHLEEGLCRFEQHGVAFGSYAP